MKYSTYYEEEKITNFKLNYLLSNKSRVFQVIITNDNDDKYIPKIDIEHVTCNCDNGDDFTLGCTWKKYFDDNNNKPVLFINTSVMFEQFKNKAELLNERKNISGAALWAQYFYEKFRDKMWQEQRTKFIFIIKQNDYIEMLNYVDQGFSIELVPIFVKKDKIAKKRILSKKVNIGDKHYE